MKIFIFLLIIGLTGVLSCSKDDDNDDIKKISISMNTACGWCAGGDSMYIDRSRLFYQTQKPCDSEVKSTTNLSST